MFTVIAGREGVVKRTRNQQEAEQIYTVCRNEAAAGVGPFAYERISLFEGDRVVREFVGTQPPDGY